MAGRFFVLAICATCIASIECEVGSLERFNQVLLQLRARVSEMGLHHSLKELDKNIKSLIDTPISPVSTLVNQTDILTKNDSFNNESNNDTDFGLKEEDEYVPTPKTENPVSQSTQEDSSITVISSSTDVPPEPLDNQTTSNEPLINGSSSTDVNIESSTKQTDLSKDTPVSPLSKSTVDITSSKEEPSSTNATESDDSTSTFSSTVNLASTTSSSKEVSDDNTISYSTEPPLTANATDLSTTPKIDNTSILSTKNPEPTTGKTNIIIPSSTEVSEDIANLSSSTESTVITDKTELTALSEESTTSTSSENDITSTKTSTDTTTRSKTVIVTSTPNTKTESTTAEPNEPVTDIRTQSSTRVTEVTNAVTSPVFPVSSTSEEQTHSTVAEISNHVKPIYNPTITTVKLALSITFMVIAVVGFVVLVGYMVKRRRQDIPYEELSLEP